MANQPTRLQSENNDLDKAIFFSRNQWVFISPDHKATYFWGGVCDEGAWLTVVDQS